MVKFSQEQGAVLITDDLKAQLPPLSDVYEDKPLTVHAHLFQFDGPFEWYVTNFDGDSTLWVLVINHAWDVQEQGCVDLAQRIAFRLCPIEPRLFQQCRKLFHHHKPDYGLSFREDSTLTCYANWSAYAR